jgi:hypothetical protein
MRWLSDDDSRLANHVRKLSQYLSSITDDAVEPVEDGPDGIVYNAMSTMEFKHKSVGATQQEARHIRTKVLGDDGVVVLNMMEKNDIEIFHAAIPNIDYRCQVMHECVTCRTGLACYAVATSQVEFVLILIVPSPIHHAVLPNSFAAIILIGSLKQALMNLTKPWNECRGTGPTT